MKRGRWREGTEDSALIAECYAKLGQPDQALEWFEKSYNERQEVMVFLTAEPYLDSMRSDPRFQHLVRRMGLPP